MSRELLRELLLRELSGRDSVLRELSVAGTLFQRNEFWAIRIKITAGWGDANRDGATMPGKGKVLCEFSIPRVRRPPASCGAFGGINRRTDVAAQERDLRRVTERCSLLKEHSRTGLGLHHRRLSSVQEMAQL